jgi:acetyl esterase
MAITAEYDPLRDEGEAYARKLGVTARRYPGTIHGFFTMPGILEVARAAMSDAAAFLKLHLAGS